jgi:4-hydroxy-tetrahydrodipicolinate synthase
MYMIKGSIVALVTPFDEKGDLDVKGLKTLLSFHLESGTDGILLLGTTGESPSVTDAEREVILKLGLEIVGDRLPLMAGVGTNSTEKTIHYAKHAESLGYEYLLVVTPYYNKPNQRGLVDHFTLVGESTSSKIVLYNVPGRTGVNLLPESIVEICRNCENVVALKDAAGNLNGTAETIRIAREHFIVMSGDDALTLPMMALGARGIISVAANVAPRDMAELTGSFAIGNLTRARELHFKLLPLMKALFIETNPIPVKAAMKLLNLPAGGVRSPLAPISEGNLKRLQAVIDDVNPI